MALRMDRISKKQFPELLARGFVVHGRYISARHLSLGGKKSLFSFVVSRKAAPTAARRNLLKRRGRAIVRVLLPRIVPGSMVAIFFKKEALAASFRELSIDFESVLGRLHLLIRDEASKSLK